MTVYRYYSMKSNKGNDNDSLQRQVFPLMYVYMWGSVHGVQVVYTWLELDVKATLKVFTFLVQPHVQETLTIDLLTHFTMITLGHLTQISVSSGVLNMMKTRLKQVDDLALC